MPRLLLCLLALCATASLAPADVPTVALSEGHRALCKVLVGDKLPAMTLATPNGDKQAIAKLFGKQATVVVFYDAAAAEKGWMTKTLLADLAPDVAKPYGKQGVATVAVSVGGPAPASVGEGVLSLVDPNGEALATVGKGRMPRVYVVDAKGKIVWLDIEYSHATRRELRETLDTLAGVAVAKAAE